MATNNTPSFTDHTSNNTVGPYAVSFNYLSEAEVDVTVDGVAKTLNTDYTFPSPTTIQFTVAPSNGASIRFQRNTNISAKQVDFQDGSVLTEADLDANTDQLIFALQEAADDTAAGIVPLGANLSASNKQIKNVADPTDAQDAVTKNFLDTQAFIKADGSVNMAGTLNANSNRISNLGNGVAATDAVNKGQLDAGIANANTAIGQAGASASAAASSATQAAASATQAAASAVTATNAASTAQNLSRTSVFVGFQRLSSGMLRMVYNLASDNNTVVYKAQDFIQNGASHAYFLGEDVLSTTAPNAPKFTLAPNTAANLSASLQGHLVLDI